MNHVHIRPVCEQLHSCIEYLAKNVELEFYVELEYLKKAPQLFKAGLANYPAMSFVFVSRHKYQKYKSVEFGDQLGWPGPSGNKMPYI